MERGYSYDFYNNVAFGFPLAFLVSCPTMVLFIAVLGFICMDTFCLKYDNEQLWTLLLKILGHIYGNQLKKKKKNYILYGRVKVSKVRLFLLFLAVVFIYICVLVSFWSQLLVSESFECTDTMDCYALNSTTSDVVQQRPLGDNCSEFEDAGYTIECFSTTLMP